MQVIPIQNWNEFIRETDKFTQLPRDPRWLFRGAANINWTLQPSIRRYFPKDASRKNIRDAEARALKEFHFAVFPHMQSYFWQKKRTRIDYWVLMQHYGAPTRLLDWTQSVFAACYFAVEHHQYIQEVKDGLLQEKKADGALWILNGIRVDELSAALLKRKQIETDNGLRNFISVAQAVDEASEAFLRADDVPNLIQCLVHHQPTDRMVAQRARFTIAFDVLADHLQLIKQLEEEAGEDLLFKITIPEILKEEFLHRLVAMNITAATLYPGIDGAGKSAAEYVALRAWESKRESA